MALAAMGGVSGPPRSRGHRGPKDLRPLAVAAAACVARSRTRNRLQRWPLPVGVASGVRDIAETGCARSGGRLCIWSRIGLGARIRFAVRLGLGPRLALEFGLHPVPGEAGVDEEVGAGDRDRGDAEGGALLCRAPLAASAAGRAAASPRVDLSVHAFQLQRALLGHAQARRTESSPPLPMRCTASASSASATAARDQRRVLRPAVRPHRRRHCRRAWPATRQLQRRERVPRSSSGEAGAVGAATKTGVLPPRVARRPCWHR